jgi:hypothetical protein
MAFWVAEVPGGGFAVGEAVDEAEARRMIEQAQASGQDRASVTWNERREQWRWTVVVAGGKTAHGWAVTEREAWAHVAETRHVPHRGLDHRGPRCLWTLPPA